MREKAPIDLTTECSPRGFKGSVNLRFVSRGRETETTRRLAFGPTFKLQEPAPYKATKVVKRECIT